MFPPRRGRGARRGAANHRGAPAPPEQNNVDQFAIHFGHIDEEVFAHLNNNNHNKNHNSNDGGVDNGGDEVMGNNDMEENNNEAEVGEPNNENNEVEGNNNNNEAEEVGEPNNNDITLNAVREGVVSRNTQQSYNRELVRFLKWCKETKPEWLYPDSSQQLGVPLERQEGETISTHNKRVRDGVHNMVRSARENPVLLLHLVTPEGFLEYAMTRRNRGTGQYLSKTSYSCFRAALYHLFRIQNRIGFPESFSQELSHLYRGFNRLLAQQPPPPQPERNRRRQPAADGEEEVRVVVKEGKEAMSVSLYKRIAGWLLDYGTIEGILM